MATKTTKCNQHGNQIQNICPHKDCNDRGMCLLCQHDHLFLPTIKQSIPLNYNKFVKKINTSIDNILASTLEKQKETYYKNKIQEIDQYFQKLKQYISLILSEQKNRILSFMEQNQDDLPRLLRKYRIEGNYLKAGQEDWRILYNLYEGSQIEEFYIQKNEDVSRKIQKQLATLVGFMKVMEQKLPIKIKQQPPIIPSIHRGGKKDVSKEKVPESNDKFDYKVSKSFRSYSLLNTSKVQFQSIISDGVVHNDLVYVSSYDKNLRVLSRDLILLKQHQFNNTLQNILPISENQLLLAVSKQVSLVQITDDHNHQMKQLLRLKGHDQKVKSLDNMNKRIVGSASAECVYIWDLYKDNQKYPIRDKVSSSVLGFFNGSKKLIIGYSDWVAKIYDVQTLKRIRNLQLGGIPLSSLKVDENVHYLGGFPNTLSLIDLRASKSIKHEVGDQGITCMKNMGGVLSIGNRSCKALVYDIRRQELLMSWEAHSGMTTWDRPNGIANISYDQEKMYTFGANDKLIKRWDMK